MKKLSVLSLIAALFFTGPVSAVAPGIEAKIKQQLLLARSDLIVKSVKQSPIKGVYEATLMGGGPVLYVSADGKHMMAGDLFEINPDGLVNLTEQAQNVVRKDLLAEVDKDDMIIFSPRGEVKGVVTVFTDVNCGWCQKFHNEVPAMNAKGIEVRYMAYPAQGGAEGYNRMVSVWCAKDKQDAMNKLKRGQRIATNICPGNPVAAQSALGIKLGVRGTPAIIFESGRFVSGYMDVTKLTAALGIN
jgi:thiol:disulfide interchange protein DsbC